MFGKYEKKFLWLLYELDPSIKFHKFIFYNLCFHGQVLIFCNLHFTLLGAECWKAVPRDFSVLKSNSLDFAMRLTNFVFHRNECENRY